jgi:diaphanous 1
MEGHVRISVFKGARGHQRTRSDSEIALQELLALAKQHGELYPMMFEILSHYGQILNRDVGM